MKINKNKRLKAIQEIISEYPVEDQEQLVELLEKNHGIETTQSIISRDLREMGVVKRTRKDKVVYELEGIDVNKEILHRAITDIKHNETVIVVNTIGGLADFVGDYIDEQESDKILGTLAGENVLIIYPIEIKKIKTTFNHVCELLFFKDLK